MALRRLDLPSPRSPHRVTATLADDKQIRDLLVTSRLWFVVGLGNNPRRPAYRVAAFLQSIGKYVVPIHPRAEIVHGQPGFASIADAAKVHGAPDVVDVFVRASRAGAFADQAIAADAKAVWFQLEVIDEAAAQRVTESGRVMVMDRCPAIEYPRLVG